MKKSQFKPPWWQSSLFLVILVVISYAMAFSGNQGLAVPAALMLTIGVPIISIVVCHQIKKWHVYSDETINEKEAHLENLKLQKQIIESELAEKQNALELKQKEFDALSVDVKSVEGTLEGAESKKQEYELYNTNPVSYTHLTLPTILRV